mgnify:CR=1 FL=1
MAGAQQLPNGIVVSHQKLKGRRNNTMLRYKGSDGYEVLRRFFFDKIFNSCLSGLRFVA